MYNRSPQPFVSIRGCASGTNSISSNPHSRWIMGTRKVSPERSKPRKRWLQGWERFTSREVRVRLIPHYRSHTHALSIRSINSFAHAIASSTESRTFKSFFCASYICAQLALAFIIVGQGCILRCAKSCRQIAQAFESSFERWSKSDLSMYPNLYAFSEAWSSLSLM